MSRSAIPLMTGLLVVAAPACVPHNAGFPGVRQIVHERTGDDIRWRDVETDADASQVDGRVQNILSQPLGPDEAVQLALMNSPALQAQFAELGIARAQLRGASLLPNPEVEGDVGFSDGEDSPDLRFAATISLSRLIFVPLRRGVASANLEVAKIEAAGAALDYSYRVRRAFYDYQAAEQVVEIFRTVLQAAAASYEIAQRLHEAGNITDLDLANERAFYEETRLAVADAEVAALNRREELNALMGLTGAQTRWRLADRLPTRFDQEPELADLERRAIERSLDLFALEQRYTREARRANLARAEGLLPDLRAGVMAEREQTWEVGPAVTLEIPLFDRGQGEVGVARARMQRIRRQYAAQAIRIRAAVRAARNQLVTAGRRVAHYQDVLLPLRQRIVEKTQLQYNAMQVGVFQLLQAKRAQIRTGREYVRALRDYWQARNVLDQILAGRLVMPSEGLTTEPRLESQRDQGEH